MKQISLLLVILMVCSICNAQADESADLAKRLQNPIAHRYF